jgi:hypothetical protein
MLLAKVKGIAFAMAAAAVVTTGVGVLAQGPLGPLPGPGPGAQEDRLGAVEKKLDRILEALGNTRRDVRDSDAGTRRESHVAAGVPQTVPPGTTPAGGVAGATQDLAPAAGSPPPGSTTPMATGSMSPMMGEPMTRMGTGSMSSMMGEQMTHMMRGQMAGMRGGMARPIEARVADLERRFADLERRFDAMERRLSEHNPGELPALPGARGRNSAVPGPAATPRGY